MTVADFGGDGEGPCSDTAVRVFGPEEDDTDAGTIMGVYDVHSDLRNSVVWSGNSDTSF